MGRRPLMKPEAGEQLVLVPTEPTALSAFRQGRGVPRESSSPSYTHFVLSSPILWSRHCGRFIGKSPSSTETEGNV